jgi:hypothetical protein
LEGKRERSETNPCGLRKYKTAIMGTKKGHYEKKEGNTSKKRVRPGATKRILTHLAPIPANAQMKESEIFKALGECKLDVRNVMTE